MFKPDGLYRLLELVGDVQLVSVEQEDDPVSSLSEPLEDPGEVVASVDQLLRVLRTLPLRYPSRP